MSDSCCDIGIDPRALQRRQRRVLAAVLAVNSATFLMMMAAVYKSGSSSLLSGALDNLGDALTYALSFAVVGSTAKTKAKVAFFKGLLISGAALGVAIQIGWRLFHVATPIVETMGVAAIVNLAANWLCLAMLTPHRYGDVNMSSVWECSRNDVFEGLAVVGAALAVWLLGSGWPDLLVALGLLIMFTRSASRVLHGAMHDLRAATGAQVGEQDTGWGVIEAEWRGAPFQGSSGSPVFPGSSLPPLLPQGPHGERGDGEDDGT